MDSNSYRPRSNFVDLLHSQQDTVFGFVLDSVEQFHVFGTQASPIRSEEPVEERRERRTWTSIDDIVLISVWLNTSKDLVIGNEQRAGAFWKRIAAYFAASPKIVASEKRETCHCKNHWQKINDHVNKFCGSYEAASKEKRSGQNEVDVLKLAHEIFYNNYNKKFTLEHAWKELRNDQKWCDLSSSKTKGSTKKRKCDDSAQSSTAHTTETTAGEDEQVLIRPPGVKVGRR